MLPITNRHCNSKVYTVLQEVLNNIGQETERRRARTLTARETACKKTRKSSPRREEQNGVAGRKGHFCESQLRRDLACKGQSYLHNASRELPPREHDISIKPRVLRFVPFFLPIQRSPLLLPLAVSCRRSSPAGLFDSPVIY